MRVNIIVKFDLEGLHSWPTAPDSYARLRNIHGHLFHFEVYVPIRVDDRQIEFLEFRRQLIAEVLQKFIYEPQLCNFGHRSCEMLAKDISSMVYYMRGIQPSRVVVMEDNFVGAEVVWTKALRQV